MIKHLLSRNYDPSRYNGQFIDPVERVVYLYLYNLSGQMVGIQQYRPDVKEKRLNDPREGRYFTRASRDAIAVWGLETYDANKRLLFVVEGVFKAATLHSLGLNAIAVLTCNPVKMESWLNLLKQKHDVIAIGDNDVAGMMLVEIVGRGFRSDDIDELPLDDVDDLIKDYLVDSN